MKLGMLGFIRPLLESKKRREVIIALTGAQMLVQLSSLPVALSLPTLAEYFDTSIADTAWIVIIYLAMLGSFVMLAARMGDRYGHARMFFLGLVLTTLGSILISFSQELWHVVMWRGFTGLGSALVLGNANAILADNFEPEERGRAFAIPIMGSRLGTLVGLAAFGLMLQYIGWRFVFISFIPVGLLAIAASIPMLRQKPTAPVENLGPLDWIGGTMLVVTAGVLILSGSHLHGGEESYVSSDALNYHIPMHVLFIALVIAFIFVERRMVNPIVDMRHFKTKAFSLALSSNIAFHFSMLATMTLMPILVEEGFGKEPIFVTFVLLPSQVLGLFMPMVAGWVYDRYRPRLLRPATLILIAGGFLLVGTFAVQAPFWALPLLMFPIAVGTNMFNPVNNATVMNSLPLEHRGAASGMMETTRELGHAFGATAAASVLALALPAGVDLLSDSAASVYYREGFQLASLMVVSVLALGGVIAYFHKGPVLGGAPPRAQASGPSLQAGGDD
jgi:MFS family permease